MSNTPGPYRFRGDIPPTASSRASILTPADAGEGVAELYLYDPIDSYGGWWGVSAKEFAEALGALPEDTAEIHLHINSPGGEIWDAMAIVNQLRRHPARVVAVVDGIAASAASVIAVTADELVMGVGAQLMIHDAWGIAIGDEADMIAAGARLSKDSNALAQVYAQKAGGTVDEWRDLMRAETWFYGAEAVEAGLADRAEGGDASQSQARAEVFDMSMFRFGGRESAPEPRIAARARPIAASPATYRYERGIATDVAPQTPVSSEPGNTTRKESPMSDALKAGLRDRLGITDADLSEDGLLAALDEALQEQAAEPAPTARVPDGTVLVDAAQFEALQAQAAEGAQARAEQVADRRNKIVDAAVADGRVSPANRQAWRDNLDRDEDGTAALLATLSPAREVPVDEIGTGVAPEGEDAAYNKLFPKEA